MATAPSTSLRAHATLASLLLSCTVRLAGDGIPVPIVVEGRVYDQSSVPLAGATLQGPGGQTVTGSNGRYSMTINGAGDRVAIRVQAPGYAPNVLVLFPRQGVARYPRNAVMIRPATIAINPATGGSMMVMAQGRMVRFTVAPGAMGTSSDTISLRVAGYDPRSGPGVLDSDSPAGERALQSIGMFYIDAADREGNPLALGAGGAIEVNYPPFNLPDIPGAQPMRAWRLDELGRWVQPVDVPEPMSGTSFTVDSFGYWNADRNYRTACVRGRVRSPSGACAGGTLRADGPDGLSSFDTTGQNGEFCVVGAQTFTSTLVLGSGSAQVRMPSTPGDCGQPESCTDIGMVSIQEDEECIRPNSCPMGEVWSEGRCVSTTSCRNRCCAGQNNACRPAGVACYCDEACSRFSDCCADVQQNCGFGP